MTTTKTQTEKWLTVVSKLRNKLRYPIVKRYSHKKQLFNSTLQESIIGNFCSYSELQEYTDDLLKLVSELEDHLSRQDRNIYAIKQIAFDSSNTIEVLREKNENMQDKIFKLKRTFFLISIIMLSIIAICFMAITSM